MPRSLPIFKSIIPKVHTISQRRKECQISGRHLTQDIHWQLAAIRVCNGRYCGWHIWAGLQGSGQEWRHEWVPCLPPQADEGADGLEITADGSGDVAYDGGPLSASQATLIRTASSGGVSLDEYRVPLITDRFWLAGAAGFVFASASILGCISFTTKLHILTEDRPRRPPLSRTQSDVSLASSGMLSGASRHPIGARQPHRGASGVGFYGHCSHPLIWNHFCYGFCCIQPDCGELEVVLGAHTILIVLSTRIGNQSGLVWISSLVCAEPKPHSRYILHTDTIHVHWKARSVRSWKWFSAHTPY
jgi:hypothetical protein